MNKWKPLSGELLKMYLQLNIWFCKKKNQKKEGKEEDEWETRAEGWGG